MSDLLNDETRKRARDMRVAIPVKESEVPAVLLRTINAEPRRILQNNGCLIRTVTDGVEVAFPAGSTRVRLMGGMCDHFQIRLPSGLELREIYDVHQEMTQLLLSIAKTGSM